MSEVKGLRTKGICQRKAILLTFMLVEMPVLGCKNASDVQLPVVALSNQAAWMSGLPSVPKDPSDGFPDLACWPFQPF